VKMTRRLLACALCLLLIIGLCACGNAAQTQQSQPEDQETNQAEQTDPSAEQSAEEAQPAESQTAESEFDPAPPSTPGTYLCLLEDGALAVNSLFTSDVPNPDEDDEPVTDLASLQVTNIGNQFLKRADITVILQDDTELTFLVTNLPAGKSLFAFDVNSTSVENTEYQSISSVAEWLAEGEQLPDGLAITVDENLITITNNSGSDMTNLTVTYHCLMDTVYYGGLSYTKTVAALPGGKSAALSAEECWLGIPELVCITAD